jgi:cation diffusion facilitator CzcD-associated flavoprotein CzcO
MLSAEKLRIVIIGAGPGGICMAIKLLEAGYDNFIMLEKAEGLGGTWWHNRYPGAACDIPSHLYSFGFEIKRDWSAPYAGSSEILAYLEMCADKYQIRPHIELNTTVTGAQWDENAACWHVQTGTGLIHDAQILIAAQGMFNELNRPDIKGLDSFDGTQFHTARWEHRHDLRGKSVGVIGSAASAVQCVPEIAKLAGEMTLFQRTANWILPKNDRPYSQRKLTYFKTAPDAVEQNRSRFWNAFDDFSLLNNPQRYQQAVDSGLANIALVDDPLTRKKLTPNYSFGCKRVLLSGNYFQTFNRANVKLIAGGIDRITATGVVDTDGVEHQLDTLILATGFDVSRYLSSIPVVGRRDYALSAAWNDGAQAYLGISTAGFPNLFQVYGPNTNKGSILFMIECQAAYIVRQVSRLTEENLAWMDVRPEVMANYNEGIQDDAKSISVWAENCNNYFRHARSGRIVTQYPRAMTRYREDTFTSDTGAYDVASRL